MALSGKQYYEVPALQVTDLGGTYWVPLGYDIIQAAGGAWAICVQDSDTQPSRMIIAVNDTVDASNLQQYPRGNTHAQIAANVSSARYLHHLFATAKGLVSTLYGSVLASRMNDQTVGGE